MTKLIKSLKQRRFFIIAFISLASGLTGSPVFAEESKGVALKVLGVAQDAGYPQLNCYQPHCMPGWGDFHKRRLATSLAVIDKAVRQKFLFEATPDIKQQLYVLNQYAADAQYPLAGIVLTHAHIGHYTGLMHLGREAAGTETIPVYVMPRMEKFLRNNGPWSQLMSLNNIVLKTLKSNHVTELTKQLKIIPLLVPHRDEYSETVGYKIIGPHKTALFIPDIDKWQKWGVNIKALLTTVDYAFIDGTFYSANELPSRNMLEIPHPFVSESLQFFENLSSRQKKKIFFIHFNHSNPLLWDWNKAGKAAIGKVQQAGFNVATEGMVIDL